VTTGISQEEKRGKLRGKKVTKEEERETSLKSL